MARAATNLSFLYFLEGDFLQAERYADVAVKADRSLAASSVWLGLSFWRLGGVKIGLDIFLVRGYGVEDSFSNDVGSSRMRANVRPVGSGECGSSCWLPRLPRTLWTPREVQLARAGE